MHRVIVWKRLLEKIELNDAVDIISVAATYLHFYSIIFNGCNLIQIASKIQLSDTQSNCNCDVRRNSSSLFTQQNCGNGSLLCPIFLL